MNQTEQERTNDLRYPRSLWFRAFRFFFHYWVLIILIPTYPILFIISIIYANVGFLSLFSLAILHNLLLDPIMLLVTNHQINSIIIGIIIVIAFYLWLANIAKRDELEEGHALHLRILKECNKSLASYNPDINFYNNNEKEAFYPPGFALRYVFPYNTYKIGWIRWLPDGRTLAIYIDGTIILWDSETGEVDVSATRTLLLHPSSEYPSWPSPDGTIILWDSETGEVDVSATRTLLLHPSSEYPSWPSPDGTTYILKKIWPISLCVRNVSDNSVLSVFPVIANDIVAVAWSSDQQTIAFVDDNGMISLLRTKNGQHIKQFASSVKEGVTTSWGGALSGWDMQSEPILVWSPDGTRIASSYRDIIKLWNVQSGTEILSFVDSSYYYTNYSDFKTCIVWSPDGNTLLTASSNIIKLWDAYTGRLVGSLQTSSSSRGTISLSFSADGALLASKHSDAVQLWRCDTWELIATLNETSSDDIIPDIVFHPTNPSILTTFGKNNKTVCIWDLDLDMLLGPFISAAITIPLPQTDAIWNSDPDILLEHKVPFILATTASPPSAEAMVIATHEEISAFSSDVQKAEELYESPGIRPPALAPTRYTNAKVILVGDSGVGKTGLGWVLTNNPYRATESTHGRYVWMFESKEVEIAHGRKETRETLLWDLAGQSGYRLVHQLHLHEVTVALVVFDARDETDPFSGVRYWCRALDFAQSLQGSAALPMKKFLVAARSDRGSIGVSTERIKKVMQELGFAHFFETSAKERLQIDELAEAIRASVDWKALPWTQSTQLFQSIKGFLVAEKEKKRILTRTEDLYRMFPDKQDRSLDSDEMRLQFETCIRQIEANGLIRRLSFGNLVLLQPELFDDYASSLIEAARQEVDGFGNISEAKVLTGSFSIPADKRIKDKEQEKFLLIALVEDLLRYDITLREQTEDGAYLVFPSQSTRENPELSNSEGSAVNFTFNGPILNIYTTLAIRIAHSAFFKKKELWKNAITYTAIAGGTCGMFLQNDGEGSGTLMLFFDSLSSEETRFLFERYIQMHLEKRSLPNTMERHRIFICPNPKCAVPLTDLQAKRAREANKTSVKCHVCETPISLLDGEERLNTAYSSSLAAQDIQEMDETANRQQKLDVNKSKVQGKRATQDFDVFLCHNRKDKLAVKEVGEKLMTWGILPWLDEWELRPGLPWQTELERQIEHIKAAAVFIGKDGIGPWQDTELRSFLSQFQKRKSPVIPVILPQCEHDPDIPLFLKEMTLVDFRQEEPDPIKHLAWGINGEKI